MFIRKINYKDKKTGKMYSAFRLVESCRTEEGPRQRMLLNLGADFTLDKEHWKFLISAIEEQLTGQIPIMHFSDEIIRFARRYAKQLLKNQAQIIDKSSNKKADYHEIDVLSLKHNDVRTVGAEHVLLSMIQDLKLDQFLKKSGLTQEQVQIAIGSIVSRAASPGSERKADYWLKNQSALGDLLDFDFEKISLYKLYKISDLLFEGKKTLELHLGEKERNIFDLEETLILYDLTNTYFEGSAASNPKASFGRSKEKRSDCPLVTMGLTLNGEGFPRKSDFFEGNASESKTLASMIESMRDEDLNTKPIVILDAGIATEENLLWMHENGFSYLVVSRKAQKSMPEDLKTIVVKNVLDATVKAGIKKVKNFYFKTGSSFNTEISSSDIPAEIQDKLQIMERDFLYSDEVKFLKELRKHLSPSEVKQYKKEIISAAQMSYDENELYCFSEARAQKEQSMKTRAQSVFESELEYLNSGLAKKGRMKKYDKVMEKVGRLKEKNKRVSSHYHIVVEKESDSQNTSSISWEIQSKQIEDRFSGVYCLRSSVLDMGEEQLWKTWVMLTEVEDAFRCMKSELGLRPIHHQLEHRVDGHLFITLLAYHLIHGIRFRLKQNNINDSWTTVRDRLCTHVRLTTVMKRRDEKLIHLRKSSEADPYQQKIYDALGLSQNPGNIERTIL